jgi:hypothetical protein
MTLSKNQMSEKIPNMGNSALAHLEAAGFTISLLFTVLRVSNLDY